MVCGEVASEGVGAGGRVVQGAGGPQARQGAGCAGGGRAAGPAAEPPTRAEPVCFDAVETACGPYACGLQGFSGAAARQRG